MPTYNEIKKLQADLTDTFDWRETDQSEDYWQDVYDALERLANQTKVANLIPRNEPPPEGHILYAPTKVVPRDQTAVFKRMRFHPRFDRNPKCQVVGIMPFYLTREAVLQDFPEQLPELIQEIPVGANQHRMAREARDAG